MLHLMIVDDDALMGNQLAAMLDWKEFGVEIVYFASDGQEAIDALKSHGVDFVMTDMEMPGVDGIALIEYISVHYPEIYVVALSAYDDFHYVRGSMKYGAHDYLLKNKLSKEVLMGMLTELKDKEQIADEMKAHQELTKEQLQESFFRRVLFRSDYDKVQIGHIVKNLNIPFNKDCLAVLIVDGDFFNDQILSRSVFHMCQQILKDADYVKLLELDQGSFCFIISFKTEVSQAAVLKKLEQWGNTIINNGRKFFNVSVNITISEVCSDISKLNQFYRQAVKNEEYFFYDDSRSLICSWAFSNKAGGKDQKLQFPDIRELKKWIMDGKQKEMTDLWEQFFEHARQMRLPAGEFAAEAALQLNQILLFGEELGASRYYLLSEREFSFYDLKNIRTLSRFKELYMSVIKRLCEAITPEYENNFYHKYTKYALKKVHTSYSQPLTLNDIASELSVTPAYISSVFKQDIGIGFNEYLNKLRIERVIEHIRKGDGKLKDIVNSVGFQNYNYFFKVFKEHTGLTPAQYFR